MTPPRHQWRAVWKALLGGELSPLILVWKNSNYSTCAIESYPQLVYASKKNHSKCNFLNAFYMTICGQTSSNFDSWSFWAPPKLVNKKRTFNSKMSSQLWKKPCLSSIFKSPSFKFLRLNTYDLTKTEKWICKKDGIIMFVVNAILVKSMKEISWILFELCNTL